MKNLLLEEHEAAVAFEYIIVIIMMVVAIYYAFTLLRYEYVTRTENVEEFLRLNGQKDIANIKERDLNPGEAKGIGDAFQSGDARLDNNGHLTFSIFD